MAIPTTTQFLVTGIDQDNKLIDPGVPGTPTLFLILVIPTGANTTYGITRWLTDGETFWMVTNNRDSKECFHKGPPVRPGNWRELLDQLKDFITQNNL